MFKLFFHNHHLTSQNEERYKPSMLNAIIPELVFHLENNTLCSKIRKAISCPTMGDYKFIKKMNLY